MRLELRGTVEDPRNYQFVEERTRQQRCYRPEFDEALGESRGTIVPPTPGAAASRSAPVRVKDNLSQSSAVLWSWRQRFPTGSVAFICISRRETIVRAFEVQRARERNPQYTLDRYVLAPTKLDSKAGFTLAKRASYSEPGVRDLSLEFNSRHNEDKYIYHIEIFLNL